MKALIVIATVFGAAVISMSLILFLGMRSYSKEERKLSRLLVALLFAGSAVLIAGFGFRSLPEKKIIPLCLLSAAWGFGVCVPLAFFRRRYFVPLAAKSKAHKEKA